MLERSKAVWKLWSLIWKLWSLRKEALWPAALLCVQRVKENSPLQAAAKTEATISFCPQCGQRPQDDRRKDEARQLLVALYPNEKRRTIDTVLSLAYWVLYK
jgi:hypothetical protein